MISQRLISAMLVVAIGAMSVLPSAPVARAADEITPEQVVTAIERAVAYLKRGQSRKGTWHGFVGYADGASAICTLALLNAGLPPSDPAVQKALAHLRTVEPQQTYTVALQTMVFCEAEPKRDRLLIERNVRWLESAQVKDGKTAGAWSYGHPGRGGDLSNSQFAVLALHEAQRVGVKIKPETWKRAHSYWIGSQNHDGSWNYGGRPPSGSMTCAGIAALVITSGKIGEGDARVDNGRILCCGAQAEDDALEKGLRWLGKHFSVQGNPSARGPAKLWHYYYLYGLERAGRMTGRRFIGKHDWYREGADYLILHAKAGFDDAWTGSGHAENNPHIATSMALLFLSKGRRPVVIAKVQHGPGDDWNNHKSDVAKLTAFTETAWEIDLTWQVYDPKAATVEDLLQAPVLFISGSRSPDLAGQEQKLRDYIDRGGFLFAEACCADGRKFDAGFRKLIERIFPEQEYQLRQLEPEHPIWRAEKQVRPDSPYVGRLWGVEYGCRTCVVYSEEDLSCAWELFRLGHETDYPPAVQQQIEDALTVGVNVLTYATNREPQHKEQSFQRTVTAEDAGGIGRRGVVQIAKLQHGGGCNDAPGALANLVRAASQGEMRLRIRDEDQVVGITEENLREYHLVFMHGRHSFRFTPAERKALRAYLERGGTLLADSICGSRPFIEAFHREMRELFADQPLARIPKDDSLLTPEYGGFDIRQVTRRDPQQAAPNEPLAARTRRVEPELEGIELDGRWAVVFSPYDISCALEKHDSLQCRGYTRKDAARIGLNVVAYMLNQ